MSAIDQMPSSTGAYITYDAAVSPLALVNLVALNPRHRKPGKYTQGHTAEDWRVGGRHFKFPPVLYRASLRYYHFLVNKIIGISNQTRSNCPRGWDEYSWFHLDWGERKSKYISSLHLRACYSILTKNISSTTIHSMLARFFFFFFKVPFSTC